MHDFRALAVVEILNGTLLRHVASNAELFIPNSSSDFKKFVACITMLFSAVSQCASARIYVDGTASKTSMAGPSSSATRLEKVPRWTAAATGRKAVAMKLGSSSDVGPSSSTVALSAATHKDTGASLSSVGRGKRKETLPAPSMSHGRGKQRMTKQEHEDDDERLKKQEAAELKQAKRASQASALTEDMSRVKDTGRVTRSRTTSCASSGVQTQPVVQAAVQPVQRPMKTRGASHYLDYTRSGDEDEEDDAADEEQEVEVDDDSGGSSDASALYGPGFSLLPRSEKKRRIAEHQRGSEQGKQYKRKSTSGRLSSGSDWYSSTK
jgi:hypothetical protein